MNRTGAISFSIILLLIATASAQVTGVIRAENNRVFVGDTAKLQIELQNNEIRPLYDVTIVIQNTNLSIQKNITIDELRSLQLYSTELEVSIPMDAAPGNYTIMGSAFFENMEARFLTEPLEIMQFPLELKFRLEKDTISSGESDNITVTAKNIGSEPIYDIIMKIDGPRNVKIEIGETRNAGMLYPGETAEKVFTFSASEPKTYTMSIMTSFIDFKNTTQRALTKSIQFTVVGEGFGIDPTWIILIIILILIGSLFFRKLA